MVNVGLILIILTIVILALIGIIAFLERKVGKKEVEIIQTPEYFVTKELEELKMKKLEPLQMLNEIDSLAKKSLWTSNEETHDYTQLAEESSEKPAVAQFCSEMAKSLYAGERITAEEVKILLKSLENVLESEGKLVIIQPKVEKIEESRFILDKWISNIAKKISVKIQEWKESRGLNVAFEEKANDVQQIKEEVEAKQIDKVKEPSPVEELSKLRTNIKPEKTKSTKNAKKKEKEEYKYIESLDVLDRIENKLKSRSMHKIN